MYETAARAGVEVPVNLRGFRQFTGDGVFT
jgi:hypothetical protein